MNTYLVHFTIKDCWIPFVEEIRSDTYDLKLFETVIKDRIDILGITLHGKPAQFNQIFFVKQVDPNAN